MLVYILGTLLCAIQFGSEWFFERMPHKKHKHITSFAAGVSVAFLFLDMMPDFSSKVFSPWAFVWILLGFSAYHLVEKYLYQHHAKRASFRQFHSGFTLLYHFALGVVLSQFARQSDFAALLFFIPLSLHLGVSSAVQHHIHPSLAQSMKKNVGLKLLYASAPLLGVIVCSIINLSLQAIIIFQGLAIGSLFFIVIRESLPRDSKGEPLWFVIGTFAYALLLWLLSYLM